MGLVDKKRAAIAGCNGSGKDCLATWAGLWLLCTRPFPKGQVTGPTVNQVGDVVWSEFKKWIDNSPLLTKLRILDWQKTHVRLREHPERAFIAARTAAKRYSRITGDVASEGIQGIHEEHTAIIITESSGVEESNWNAAESCCTRPDNYLLAVGNPLRREGRFYDVFNKPQYEDWHKCHVSYLESSWVDRATIEGWLRRYGKDSAFCQVRCFGQFPSEGSPDSALSWDLVMAAMSREAGLHQEAASGNGSPMDLQFGVDAARFGTDESTIAIRMNQVVKEVRAYKRTSGPQLVGHVIAAVSDYGGDKDTLIVADEAGLGGSGLVDPLRQVHGYSRVIGVHNAMPARLRPDLYEHWDDEAWMEDLGIWLEAGGTLPYDDVLLAQLTTRKFEFTGKTGKQRRLESKDKLRARGLSSPDRAEAVIMACAEPPGASIVLPFAVR